LIFGKEIVTQEIKNKVLESLNSHRQTNSEISPEIHKRVEDRIRREK